MSLNCFLKAHKKQLNQYCLYFILFLPKKKSFKNGSGSGWVYLQKIRVGSWVNPFLFQVKKIEFRLGILRVGSSWVRIFWLDLTWTQFFLFEAETGWPMTWPVFFCGSTRPSPWPNMNHFLKHFFLVKKNIKWRQY